MHRLLRRLLQKLIESVVLYANKILVIIRQDPKRVVHAKKSREEYDQATTYAKNRLEAMFQNFSEARADRRALWAEKRFQRDLERLGQERDENDADENDEEEMSTYQERLQEFRDEAEKAHKLAAMSDEAAEQEWAKLVKIAQYTGKLKM